MKSKIVILISLLSSMKLVQSINVPGYSTKEEEVKIPKDLQNAIELELNIRITDPIEDGSDVVCEVSDDVSGELDGVMNIDIREKTATGVYISIEQIEIKLHDNECNKTVPVLMQHKSILDVTSLFIKIDTSDLQLEKNVEFTLRNIDSVGKRTSLTAILVPVILIGIIIAIIVTVIMFKKKNICVYLRGSNNDTKDGMEDDVEDPNKNIPLLQKIKVHPVDPNNEFEFRVDLSGSSDQNIDSSVKRHRKDFESLRSGLENSGKYERENLPNLPDQIGIAAEGLEEFINKIEIVASTDVHFQLFTNKVLDRMTGKFQIEIEQCENVNEVLKELKIDPNCIRLGEGKPPTLTQTITAMYETGKIFIETFPITQIYQGGFWYRWTACDSSPPFQLDISFKETTIFGKKTTTTATIEDNKLIKLQIPDGDGKRTKETREMVDDDTMRMEVIVEGTDISCEFVCRRIKSDAL